MHPIRILVRHAQRLSDAWAKGRQNRNDFDYHWSNVSRGWINLLALQRQLELAQSHGLQEAHRSVQEDFRWKLDELSRHLHSLREDRVQPVQEPILADWLRELQALEDEFGQLHVDARLGILRVRTEAITLNDVELGPFNIELHWSRLASSKGSSCFEIIAVESNPASGRDEVTHPHVNDGELCAGDAAKPIENALADGRISDAFLLIRSVLKTYNARSAYVQLEEWDGLSCSDCGGRIRRDYSSYCEGCQSDLCESCVSSCRSCEETRCGSCLNSCDGCSDLCCARCLEIVSKSESLCSSCRGICSDCNKVLCQSELDEAGHCPDCAMAEESPNTPILEDSNVS
ncbi:hypothetical protein BH11PLA2_BH11PLA2_48700 [soil metagenome]